MISKTTRVVLEYERRNGELIVDPRMLDSFADAVERAYKKIRNGKRYVVVRMYPVSLSALRLRKPATLSIP